MTPFGAERTCGLGVKHSARFLLRSFGRRDRIKVTFYLQGERHDEEDDLIDGWFCGIGYPCRV